MSRKPESLFIARVNRHLPLAKVSTSAKAREQHPGVLIHYEKMNNPYSSGTADAWYSGVGGDLWVEFKFLPRIPQRVNIKPAELLSALQLDWLNARHDEGRNVAVIIGCHDGGIVLRDRDWEKELSPQAFSALVDSHADLASWIRKQTVA